MPDHPPTWRILLLLFLTTAHAYTTRPSFASRQSGGGYPITVVAYPARRHLVAQQKYYVNTPQVYTTYTTTYHQAEEHVRGGEGRESNVRVIYGRPVTSTSTQTQQKHQVSVASAEDFYLQPTASLPTDQQIRRVAPAAPLTAEAGTSLSTLVTSSVQVGDSFGKEYSPSLPPPSPSVLSTSTEEAGVVGGPLPTGVPSVITVPGGQLLKVLNLNLWGLGWPLGEDKDLRVLAIRDELLKGNYDIVLLQELWYRSDYDLLRSTMPYVSQYDSINSGCSSFIIPLGCSGLTILSKYPILDVRLVPFNHRGNFWRFDGEIFVRKGVGIARIQYRKKTIDVFTTHLVSYTKADDNKLVRYMQAMETVNLISKSDADITIFGGDINATPIESAHQPYGMLRTVLRDSLIEKYPGASFHPVFASFGNQENTYTRQHRPERIDYLMFRSVDSVQMSVLEFTMPIMMTQGSDGRLISVSDHEALSVTFLVQDRRNDSIPRIL